MADGNGDYRRIIEMLVEQARLNLEEHERIWQAIEKTNASVDRLSTSVDRLGTTVDRLVGAIRDLIDRIPPQNLRNP